MAKKTENSNTPSITKTPSQLVVESARKNLDLSRKIVMPPKGVLKSKP